MALKTKPRAFVEAYLANGFNATKAAKAAGYSEKTAYSQGGRLLKNVEIKQEIEKRLGEMTMSANEALYRLTEHAKGNLSEFIKLSPEQLKLHPQAHLLKKFKMTTKPGEEQRVEIELYDAQNALINILKEQHLIAGEATDRTEMTGRVQMIEIVRDAPTATE